MKCPKCKHENPDGAKFGNECTQEFTGSAEPSPLTVSFDEKESAVQIYKILSTICGWNDGKICQP